MLRTSRLTLSPLRGGDHDALLRLWRMPEVREFLFDGEVLSSAQVAAIIADSEKDFATENFGFWGLRETGVDEILLGTAGLRRLDGGPELEVVYSLDPGYRGRGLASEAAAAVVSYAFEVLGLDRVLAEIDEGNTASIAVVERLGMRAFETVPGVLGPMIHYLLEKPASGVGHCG
ncbi:GNAT family N-acetyltransferase [Nocardia sp. ET3-3]|uniref:GNAT family N-acetyltransferase n=1 Tax=Nocardia terrae TaxID=2675851 RepID=A0A7K1UQJ8_9NOCA|nr:GNAT family N-acetyltransferase [Nocardia terrae]MVU76611.1 GNAT family N-acetyltransferase [Nocardia terrae]